MDQPRGIWIFRRSDKFEEMRFKYSKPRSVPFFEKAEFVLADHYFRNDPKSNDENIINFFSKDYDWMMFGLPLRDFVSIRIVELAHWINTKTRLIINTSSGIDPAKLLRVFDGCVDSAHVGGPDEMAERIRGVLAGETKRLGGEDLREALSVILRDAGCFGDFADKSGHGPSATYEEYRTAWRMPGPPGMPLPPPARRSPAIQIDQAPAAPVHIFYSYSHEDEKFRVVLEKHLKLLERQGTIAGYHDRKIGAGQEWKRAIDQQLEEAQVILLLVSSSFLASDYCWDVETTRAIERHDRREATVIPIILRPCVWHQASFGKLQALPKDGKAITSWKIRDAAWTDVAKGIQRAVENISREPP
jgi:TIR domain